MRLLRSALTRPAIVHETPRRLRLKMPVLTRARIDTDHLVGLLTEVEGVRSARINIAAASVIVAYDGKGVTRQAVLDRLSDIKASDLRVRDTPSESAPNLAPLALRFALLLAIRCFPLRSVVF